MCTIKLAQFESRCNCFTYYIQRPVLLSWHCHRIGSAWYAQFFHSLVRRHGGRPVTDSGSPPAARRHGQWQAQPPPSRPGPLAAGDRWPVSGHRAAHWQSQSVSGAGRHRVRVTAGHWQRTTIHTLSFNIRIFMYIYVYVCIRWYM